MLAIEPFYEQAEIRLELLVQGRSVALGFRFLDGNGRATIHRDFGVALGPGSVVVRPVVAGDQPFYSVQIRTPLPFDTGGACWLGRLVVRVTDTTSSDQFATENQSYVNTYWEFGACE